MSTIEATLADFRKDVAELRDSVKSLSQPNYRSSGDNTRSYFEQSTEYVTIDEELADATRGKRHSVRTLPGYQGAKKSGFGHKGDFFKSLITSGSTSDWRNQHASIFKGIQGMQVGTMEDGGALVPPEFAQGILERIYNNDLFSRTDSYTVSGNNMTFNRSAEVSRKNGKRAGGAQAYWTGEGNTLTDSSPKLKQVKLRLNKLIVLVRLTEEVMSDTPEMLMQYIEDVASREFMFAIADSLFNGTGVGMPLGIHNAPALLTLAKEGSQAGQTIVAANIDKMWARKISGGNYAWYHNQDCNPQLDALTQTVGTGGVTLYRPADGLVGAQPALLKNAPRVETEFNRTLGTVGDITLADFSKIVSIQKGGVSQQASIHAEFKNDVNLLKFTMRLDAKPWEDSPVEPYQGSNTQSAFVTVETRAG